MYTFTYGILHYIFYYAPKVWCTLTTAHNENTSASPLYSTGSSQLKAARLVSLPKYSIILIALLVTWRFPKIGVPLVIIHFKWDFLL